MSIHSTSSVNANNFYPNPTSKETLNYILGVTEEFESEKMLFTQEKLKETASRLDEQNKRRRTGIDYEYVNPNDIKTSSQDKKITKLIKQLANSENTVSSDLRSRIKVK